MTECEKKLETAVVALQRIAAKFNHIEYICGRKQCGDLAEKALVDIGVKLPEEVSP